MGGEGYDRRGGEERDMMEEERRGGEGYDRRGGEERDMIEEERRRGI